MSYPVTFEADYVERRNRLTAFFRLILAIPLAIWLYLYAIVALIAHRDRVVRDRDHRALPAGPVRLRRRLHALPHPLHRLRGAALRPLPVVRRRGDPAYPVRMDFAGPLEHYSRLKTLFRVILAIPLLILRYVMGLLLEVGAFAAWFVILVTGKMPRGLFDLMVLANSYTARSDAYLFLLTETYPPFQDEQTRSAGLDSQPAAPTAAPAPPAPEAPEAPQAPDAP